ncbi:MAG: hypothetical protein HPY53_05505 [Brevinematales bacterium]|nr:hypothetical protein [Brevinematales bacterium]
MKFEIKKETRGIGYSENQAKTPKKAIAAAAIILGVSILAGYNSVSAGGYAKDGDVAMLPALKNKGEVMQIFKDLFKKKLPMNFKQDYQLKLKDKNSVIEFEADLYNSDAKIAVEWVSASNYTKNEKTSMILTSDETALIKGYVFDSTYILVIPGIYEYEVKDTVKKFIDFYMKQ